MKIEICTRCGGRGKVEWSEIDNGICYKCEGKGYIGDKTVESDEYISDINKANINRIENQKKMESVLNYLSKEILKDSAYGYYESVPQWIALNGVSEYRFSNMKKWVTDLFETPYFKTFEYLNPKNYSSTDERAVKEYNILKDLIFTISSENKSIIVKVEKK